METGDVRMKHTVKCRKIKCLYNTGWKGHYSPECSRARISLDKEGKCMRFEEK